MFVQKRLGKTRKHQKETGGDWDRTEQDETRLTKTNWDQIGQKQNVPGSDRNVEKMENPEAWIVQRTPEKTRRLDETGTRLKKTREDWRKTKEKTTRQ